MATQGTLLGVGLAVMLRDQFSGPASRINQSSKNLKQNLSALASAQGAFFRNLGITSVAMSSAWYGLSRVITAGAQYKYTLISVKAVTQATTAELDKLDRMAMRLGQNTIYHSDQVADAMKYMGMAGLTYKEIMESIPAAVNLAGATDSALQGKLGTADIMTNVMKTFNIETSKAAAVADILTVATVKANTNLVDLAQGIKYAGSTANSLNIPLQELTAGLMLLSNAGIQSSMAGVAMENAMRYFARAIGPNATGRQARALAYLGLTPGDFMDQYGRILSLPTIFEKLQIAMKKVGTGSVMGQNLLDDLFGVRGKRAATLLIRDGDQLKGFVEQLNNSAGLSQNIMDQRMNSLWGHILQLTTVIKHLGIVFTASIEGPLKFFMKGLTAILKGLVNIMQLPFFKQVVGPTIMFLTIWRLAAMAIRLAGMGFDVLRAKAALASGEAISSHTKQNSLLSMLAANINKATIAQEGLTAAVKRTVMAYYSQGAAASAANGAAAVTGAGAMLAGGATVKGVKNPNNWSGYVVREKTKNPWGAPTKIGNGQWVVYSESQGHKIFNTREEARKFRRANAPEVYRPATTEEIKRGIGVSWFGSAPGTTRAENARRAAQAASNVRVGTMGKILTWLPWLGRIGGWLGRAVGWLGRIGGLLIKGLGALFGPVGLIVTTLVSIGLTLWDWFGHSKDSDKKKQDSLDAIAKKDVSNLLTNGESVRLANLWLNQNQTRLRSYEAEVIKQANLETSQRNYDTLRAMAKEFPGNGETRVLPNPSNTPPVNHIELNIALDGEAFEGKVTRLATTAIQKTLEN